MVSYGSEYLNLSQLGDTIEHLFTDHSDSKQN